MAFTDIEIAAYTVLIEELFWFRRRPPLHLRDQLREGQRFTGHAIELFFVRPAFNRPGVQVEESLAKVQYVRTRQVWHIFWKRADGKWHRYAPCPATDSLPTALHTINADPHGCFFG